MFRTKYAKKYVALAKKAHKKDKDFRVFGAETHRYSFAPCAGLLVLFIHRFCP